MKRKKIVALAATLVLCFILAGCDEARVNVLLNISTETGAGDIAFDIYLRWDDDTKDALPNGVDGVKNSLAAYCESKGMTVAISDVRTETVQFWDDDTDDKIVEDHEAQVFNIQFTFDSLEDLNAKIKTLSDNGTVASSDGFAVFAPNDDGTKTLVYRNHAIEEVLTAMTSHVKADPDAYSGDSELADMSKTQMFLVTIDGEYVEKGLGAYASFPNRTYEVKGSYVDASLIVTPEPTSTPVPTKTPVPTLAPAAQDTADSGDSSNTVLIVVVVVVVLAVLCAAVLFVMKGKKKK